MSLQKREIAKQIVQLQEELSAIVKLISNSNYELEDERDYVNSLHLKAIVLERDIDQLQKQFSNIKEYEDN